MERSCLHEILGLEREEPSFDDTRHSHSSRCDSLGHNRAARPMPEGYWAAIATLVVMQSSLGATLTLSIVFRLEKTAYRYASITLAIVVLIPRSTAPGIIALHRFLEVSVGIIVALAVVAVWPEHRRLSVRSTAQ